MSITSAMLNRNAGLPLLGGRPIAASSHEKTIGGGKNATERALFLLLRFTRFYSIHCLRNLPVTLFANSLHSVRANVAAIIGVIIKNRRSDRQMASVLNVEEQEVEKVDGDGGVVVKKCLLVT
ncbi:hypothetical protein F2Q70_00023066 [Brassica cretica]|uniref:Uncharacterized protein n=2 Tax=Brassica cretica TaxID=69181 RepID=A0A8S9HN21_BRACR|nr:hypothetical protein F2Q70_00023066 [Brassica cretica]KAF2557802.1 hypothetical protein F2Q68_00017354 [Brassica cretica]KAF3609901.1 hypothetical protein DY000_02050065 [Brassica cretica]